MIRWHLDYRGCCGWWWFIIESLSKRRFCQHGRQPEVSCVVIDGEWWRQPFLFEINNGSQSTFTFMISNKNGWRHHSPSVTAQHTSGCRPCWQKRRLLKLSNRTFITLGINGGYSRWSAPKKCTQSCGGGVRLRRRKCNNPKPSLNGKDCYGPKKRLAAPKWCNVQVNYIDKNIPTILLMENTSPNTVFPQYSNFRCFFNKQSCPGEKSHRDRQCEALGYPADSHNFGGKRKTTALNVSQHSEVLVDAYCNTSIERRHFKQRSTVTFSKNAVLFYLASP